MSNINGVTYICSAGLSSVTSAGALGPYFALTHFLPVYDFRIDKNICDTAALNISGLNYTSASHGSLSNFEIIYNNPELSGFGSYSLSTFNAMYKRNVLGTGPLFTNTLQRNGDNKVNVLNGKVLENLVSATGFSNVGTGSLSAVGSYSNITDIQTWNPLSATSSNWNYRNLFRVTSYSPNQSTSGMASGNYKCRIPAGSGSFKFNMLAIYATRVNQYGYYDAGQVGSPFNPTLFAIVCFETPQIKTDVAGSLNAFEANVELQFSLQSSAAIPVYINTDYFTRIPTSNTTSAYALNYDGDLVISTSAEPGSWVPKAKLTVTDSEKTQLHLANDDLRFTTITTNRFKPYSNYPANGSADMAVLDIDTSCPDDSLLQGGYNCVATGIKSVALGCYSSATGYSNTWIDLGQTNPTIDDTYTSQRGGYTFSYGVENLSEGLASTTFGYSNSAIGFGSFAGGYKSIASSDSMDQMYYGSPSEGMNFSYGFKTSAIGDTSISQLYPDGTSPSSLSNWFNGLYIYGGNFATNIQTVARGNGNASFNINTVAYGVGNTSFGMYSSATGILSLATGLNTLAKNILSQAHGQSTSATAILSHVYGGNALADTNGIGSWTFGAPFLYGSDSGIISTSSPSYSAIVLNNGVEEVSNVSTVNYSTNKYDLTYNNGMGTFLFGMGSSASINANHSVIFGISNDVFGAYSRVFGSRNKLGYGSDYATILGGNNEFVSSNYSSVDGYRNTLTTSNYSYITGIFNTLTLSENSITIGYSNILTTASQNYIFGDNNKSTSTTKSTILGRLNNISNSTNSLLFGNYNIADTVTNSMLIGSNVNMSNSVNSYGIGNNVIVQNAMNSIAIGYGSSVTGSNIVEVGSCSLEKLNLIAPEINISAAKCNSRSKTKITIAADEVEIKGYTPDELSWVHGLRIYHAPQNNELKIKLFRIRNDIKGLPIDSAVVKIKYGSEAGGRWWMEEKYFKNNVSIYGNSYVPTEKVSEPISYLLYNPKLFRFSAGTAATNEEKQQKILDLIKDDWVLLAEVDANRSLATDRNINTFMFNTVKKFNIYVNSDGNDFNNASVFTYLYFSPNQQNFTTTIDDLNAYISIAGDNKNAKIYFMNRSGLTGDELSTEGTGRFGNMTDNINYDTYCKYGVFHITGSSNKNSHGDIPAFSSDSYMLS